MDKQKSWPGRASSLDRESLEPLASEARSAGVQDSVAELPLPMYGKTAQSPKLHRPTPQPQNGVSTARVSTTSVRSDAPSLQSVRDEPDELEDGPDVTDIQGREFGNGHLASHLSHGMDESLLGSDAGVPHSEENGLHQPPPPRHVRFHSRESLQNGGTPTSGSLAGSIDQGLSRPSGGEATLASADHTGNREAKSIATNHIRSQEEDLMAVVRFLRTTPNLSYDIVGELLGEPSERCCQVLELFTDSFDFSGLPFETALRAFLEAFRLPGESQKIYRILQAFAEQYWRQCGRTSPFRSADAVLVLAFSVVILNTDLHNPAVKPKEKMSMQGFVHNNRGINDESDFNPKLLEELYLNIQQQSLRVPVNAQLPTASELPRMRSDGAMLKRPKRRICCLWW